MEGVVGAQVVAPPPSYVHHLTARFCESPNTNTNTTTTTSSMPMPKKRHLSYQSSPNFPHFTHPNNSNWNPNLWEWDSNRFVAKPLHSQSLQLNTASATATATAPPLPQHIKKDESQKHQLSSSPKNSCAVANEDDHRLQLNLGGSLNSVGEPVSRPNKKVRSGSPGNATYPMCQVDNCKEDLSNAKDYHRRHKVCELHSKSAKALVGKQMQRFCQQCSRFHPLSEFDEGKRSCRRRLAGHNKRRRKTQPEDVTSRLLIPGNRENNNNGNFDIVNLLAAFARAQGKNDDRSINGSSVPNGEQLLQILTKINSLPLPQDLAAKLQNVGTLNKKNPEQLSLDLQSRLNGNVSSPLTMDLLAVLSATLTSSAPDALAMLSQRSSQCSDSDKTKLKCPDQTATPNLPKQTVEEFPSAGGERSSTSYQCSMEDSDYQVQQIRPNLPLQLFSSSPENDGPPKLASSRKYYSSDSSNPIEERSPSSSPVVQNLFPMQSTSETMKPVKMSINRELNANVKGSLPLDLFRGPNRVPDRGSCQSPLYQNDYTSSSGSDHSPPSLNSDTQDRTGRIIFKLFDKDPSHLPESLRAQIYNWLSSSPSEMESYIRPGCVVVSIYVSMSANAWEDLEQNLLQHLNSLVQDSDSEFWRGARFLLNTGRQLASYKDGNIRLCKSCRSWNSPQLISVSPLAIVGGQETSLLLRGRNLASPGTKIHCTSTGGYVSKEVTGSTNQAAFYDEINLGGFKIQGASPGILGRCFIEVENGFKGNSFPIIVANSNICEELRLLESEFDLSAIVSDTISDDQTPDFGRPRSAEEVLHFLNELGWLFQRKGALSMIEGFNYSLSRFKFLLVFSVERDYCALVKALLDLLVEENLSADGLSRESLDTLSEIQLLNRAVKRRSRKMADLLIHYTVTSSGDGLKKNIFPPNLSGPGGITPLHLAACTSGSEDMVDALTSDPQEIGLSGWNTLLDESRQSPYAYAVMRDNHSYNKLVARKLADKSYNQVSVTIGMEIEESEVAQEHAHKAVYPFKQDCKSCAKCATVAAKCSRRVLGGQGLLQRPYIHSILAIAAVCVCVCLFARGLPYVDKVAPIRWEKLDFGTI